MMKQEIYTPNQDFKVLVRCFTYNQSKYIEDALNGFAMQKTSFPFVCLVMDDCSTDGEQDVIKAWMERECDMSKAEYIDLELSNVILVPHKTNANCTFAIYLLKRNLWTEPSLKDMLVEPWREHCDYEAICEGDDYWIEPKKIQLQSEYLDSHNSCALVYSMAKTYKQNICKFVKSKGSRTETFRELLLENGVVTLTAMYRIDAIKGYTEYVCGRMWLMGDKPLWLYLSINNTIHFDDNELGVYRMLDNSASSRSSFEARELFLKSSHNVSLFFAKKKAPDMVELIEDNTNKRLFRTACDYRKYKKAKEYYRLIRTKDTRLAAKFLLMIFNSLLDNRNK